MLSHRWTAFLRPVKIIAGRGGGTRTRDPSVPNAVRYLAALLPDISLQLYYKSPGPEPGTLPLRCAPETVFEFWDCIVPPGRLELPPLASEASTLSAELRGPISRLE